MNLEKIETEVTTICREVGEFIAREGASFDLSKIEQKQVFNNLVSYVDKEAEKSLVKTLSRLVPGAGFITEEGTVEQKVPSNNQKSANTTGSSIPLMERLIFFMAFRYMRSASVLRETTKLC
jgi:fructose-1,6-bisphosphatase/inositol monophosphatase family enzyme